jgi:hypothetical protein
MTAQSIRQLIPQPRAQDTNRPITIPPLARGIWRNQGSSAEHSWRTGFRVINSHAGLCEGAKHYMQI